MSDVSASQLLLCGSVPMTSAEEVFDTCGPLFGDVVSAIPDGETGERSVWIMYEAYRLFRPHPDVQTERRPAPKSNLFGIEGPLPEWLPAHLWDCWEFRLKPGVASLRFDRWPRIDDAIASYEAFHRLRDEGKIPDDVRFQVCLPWPHSALGFFFRENFANDYEILLPAWEELVGRELGRLFEAIPADDLAIQWDVCVEVLDLEGLWSWTSGDAWKRFVDPLPRLCPFVPESSLMGFHLCYGTFPEWPMREPQDMGLIVRMANATVNHSGRRVDWVHLAGPRHYRSDDEGFFRPLRDLDIGDTRVYLGLMQPHDAITGNRGLELRVATARRHLANFGLANYCGFGRQPGVSIEETLRTHRAQLEAVSPLMRGSAA
jgi:hypothetical protein